MFKRLAPVIELSESCSESSSPAHKRSQTQHKTRFVSPMHSDVQVWQIIQSRRNLDKKMRLVKSRVISDHNRKNCRSPPESGNANLANEKKKSICGKVIGKDKENRDRKEMIAKKVEKARIEVKLQYAIDLEFIKKRNEIIFLKKREKVLGIKSSLAAGKHKRTVSGQALREISSSGNISKNKIENRRKLNQTLGVSDRNLLVKDREAKRNNRSLSVLVSPRNYY